MGVGGSLVAWSAAAALAFALALWMRSAGRWGSEDEVEDVDEAEDEEEVVVLGDAGCALMRAAAGLWAAASAVATAGRVEGMSSGCRLGLGGLRGPAVNWLPGGAILSAAVGEGGAGLRSSPSGLGWAGVLQCVRLCGFASAGGNSSRGLHSAAGGGLGLGFLGCAGGACAGHWAGWACRRVWGSPWWLCAGRGVWGVVRVSGWWVRGGRVLLFARVGEARVAGPGDARDGGHGWVFGWAMRGEGYGQGLRGFVCCVGACVRSQRHACVVGCRPGGLEGKRAVFCCRGKDFADELAYLLDLLVSGGKGVC